MRQVNKQGINCDSTKHNGLVTIYSKQVFRSPLEYWTSKSLLFRSFCYSDPHCIQILSKFILFLNFQFKELMNKIDPDDDDDEEGTGNGGQNGSGQQQQQQTNSNTSTPVKKDATSSSSTTTPSKHVFISPNKPVSKKRDDEYVPSGPGRHEPARSSHQPHQQAFMKYQQQQQQQLANQNAANSMSNSNSNSSRSRSTRAAAVAATAAVSTNNTSSGNMILDPETGEMVPAGSDGEEDYDEDDYEDEDEVQVVETAKTKPVLINLGQSKSHHSSSSSSKQNNVQVCVWSLVISFFHRQLFWKERLGWPLKSVSFFVCTILLDEPFYLSCLCLFL